MGVPGVTTIVGMATHFGVPDFFLKMAFDEDAVDEAIGLAVEYSRTFL
jgi:hypothetical protein